MHGNAVECSTTSTGTGNLTISAITGLKTPHGEFGTSQPFRYVIRDSNQLPIEIGIGQMSDSTTLVRKWVNEKFDGSSWTKPNAASGFLNIAAGTKYVVCAPLAGSHLQAPSRPFCLQNGTANNRLLLPSNVLATSTGAITLTLNRLYSWPIYIPHRCQVDALCARTSGTGANIDFGLYRLTYDGLPDALIASAIGVASAAGTVFGTFTAVELEAGWYAAALATDNGTPSYYNSTLSEGYGATDPHTQVPALYKTFTAGGALPNPFGTPTSIGTLANVPAMRLRLTN